MRPNIVLNGIFGLKLKLKIELLQDLKKMGKRSGLFEEVAIIAERVILATDECDLNLERSLEVKVITTDKLSRIVWPACLGKGDKA